MKTYPSITRSPRRRKSPVPLHLFDKIDGSNLRFEWSSRTGWTRFGTRRRVIDPSDPVFGGAMGLFQETFADPIAAVASAQGWDALVAFGEFWGESSLGGQHASDEPHQIVLFDVAPFRRGFVGPQRFMDLFGHLPIPRYLGEHAWDDALIDRVRRDDLPGVTCEGVVGKSGDGHRTVMAKAKTQRWIDKILARYGEEVGRELVLS